MRLFRVHTCKPLFNTDAALTGSEEADLTILQDTGPESVHSGFVGSLEAHISNNYPSQIEVLGIWHIVWPVAPCELGWDPLQAA